MVQFESLGTVSYSHPIATMAVSLAVLTQYIVYERDRQKLKAALMHRIARQKAKTHFQYRKQEVLSWKCWQFGYSGIMVTTNSAVKPLCSIYVVLTLPNLDRF